MIRQAHIPHPPSRLHIAAVSIAELLLLLGLIGCVVFFFLMLPNPKPTP
jgi:hypothetical protein